MEWDVKIDKSLSKKLKKIPKKTQDIFQLLLAELSYTGPMQGTWPNFGKLSCAEGYYHCHLQRGSKPTYVAVWKADKKKKLIEVIHIGTHEKTDYNKIAKK